MSRIKDIIIDKNIVNICLESDNFFRQSVDDEVVDFCYSIKDRLLGLEIFDQKSIDNIISSCGNRSVSFSVSKMVLCLGSIEAGVPIFNYIGDNNCIPKVIFDDFEEKLKCLDVNGNSYGYCYCNDNIISYNDVDYIVIDINKYFTITDIVEDVFNFKEKDIVLSGDDDIICDLSIGLCIPFIKVRDINIINRLNYILE